MALLLAACGGTAAPAPASGAVALSGRVAELASYQGANRQQQLEAAAKKEGALNWYTSLAGEVVDNLANGFKQKYGIPVDVFRATEDGLITRATQEAEAGKQVFDVLESPASTGEIVGDAKLLAPFYSPGLANLPKELQRHPQGATAEGAAIRMTLIGFGYNTTLIPESAVPKTLEDLMNPALAGKLSLAGTNTGYRWAASVLKKMGDDPGKKWLAGFSAQQKPQVQQVSGKAVFDLIAKGEVPASPTIFRDHVEQGAAQKAPVRWVPLEPVVANIGQVNLAGKAPHPNAGLLFIDYALGPDGQKVLKDSFYALPTEKPNFQIWVPEDGRTGAQDEQDMNNWAQLFKTNFR
ncbi:MAG TPA: extracellular solute-binding protein [Chloroflexota bacterium]|nr:extracellular solute-binding protein [Chloroflexota bacterium]